MVGITLRRGAMSGAPYRKCRMSILLKKPEARSRAPMRRAERNSAEILNEIRWATIGSGNMSLPALDAQSQLFSTAALADEVFSATDRYRLFAQKIYPLLLEVREQVAKAYCADNGRPGIEPVWLLGVSLLQYLEGAPDRQ